MGDRAYVNHVTSAIVIEDSIPMPPPYVRGPRRKYPLPDLAVGQSFAVPGGDTVDRSLRSVVTRYKQTEGKGKNFTVSTRSDPGKIRVWRTA